jgi:uncharacterized protein YjiS (DUF1127 family)
MNAITGGSPYSKVGSSPIRFGFGTRTMCLPLAAAARWLRIRRAIQEVAQHDDLMLKDIGIHRSEIERAVRCGRGS